jgi:hypothetical protein
LRKRDVHAFVELLPDWDELARGLRAVVLAPGELDAHGWHDLGTVAVCAWDENLWQWVEPAFFEEHRAIVERLGVPSSGARSSARTRCDCAGPSRRRGRSSCCTSCFTSSGTTTTA